MHRQLDARGPRIGEQVAVVGMGGTDPGHHAGQQAVGAGAHVHRRGAQPQLVDAERHPALAIRVAATARADATGATDPKTADCTIAPSSTTASAVPSSVGRTTPSRVAIAER